MLGQFQRLNCEVNTEKSYSTDSSSFNERLKNNHCYENKKKSLIDFSIHRFDASYWRLFWHKINRRVKRRRRWFCKHAFDLGTFVVDPRQ